MSAEAVDRRNRVRLSILGLLLLVLGVVALLARAGVLDLAEPQDVWGDVANWAQDNEVFAVIGLVLLGLLLLLLGLRWPRQQISSPGQRLRELTLPHVGLGTTTLEADGVSRALAKDVERLPAVQGASARLVGAGPRPHVAVRANIDADTDLASLNQAMEGVYGRLAGAMGAEGIEADLHVKPVTGHRPRVT